jgi:hypothetical protein
MSIISFFSFLFISFYFILFFFSFPSLYSQRAHLISSTSNRTRPYPHLHASPLRPPHRLSLNAARRRPSPASPASATPGGPARYAWAAPCSEIRPPALSPAPAIPRARISSVLRPHDGGRRRPCARTVRWRQIRPPFRVGSIAARGSRAKLPFPAPSLSLLSFHRVFHDSGREEEPFARV